MADTSQVTWYTSQLTLLVVLAVRLASKPKVSQLANKIMWKRSCTFVLILSRQYFRVLVTCSSSFIFSFSIHEIKSPCKIQMFCWCCPLTHIDDIWGKSWLLSNVYTLTLEMLHSACLSCRFQTDILDLLLVWLHRRFVCVWWDFSCTSVIAASG